MTTVTMKYKFETSEQAEFVATKMIGVERYVIKELGAVKDHWVLRMNVRVDMLADVARNLQKHITVAENLETA